MMMGTIYIIAISLEYLEYSVVLIFRTRQNSCGIYLLCITRSILVFKLSKLVHVIFIFILACSKFNELNDTINELQKRCDSKTSKEINLFLYFMLADRVNYNFFAIHVPY